MWFTAHAIITLRLIDDSQVEFHAWENIILIEAVTEEEANRKAEARAREDEGGELTVDGKPAEFVFVGVRKLMKCVDPETRPGDGTEVTFNNLYFADQQSLDDFAAGKEAQATFDDEAPIEE